jgi:hypothetical protein
LENNNINYYFFIKRKRKKQKKRKSLSFYIFKFIDEIFIFITNVLNLNKIINKIFINFLFFYFIIISIRNYFVASQTITNSTLPSNFFLVIFLSSLFVLLIKLKYKLEFISNWELNMIRDLTVQ